jgi:hypothetical protein
MGSKYFGNQEKEQIIAHIKSFLRPGLRYNLKIDPLGIHFEIFEAVRREERKTNREQFGHEVRDMTQKERRRFNLKRRRTNPKIRSVKRGRTVSLKGIYS